MTRLLPDPRHLQFPVDQLASIPQALSDIAHKVAPSLSTSPPVSTSPSHVATRLAHRVHSQSIPVSTPSPNSFSNPTPLLLSRETALVYAYGLHACTFLPLTTTAHISHNLESDVTKLLSTHIPNLPSLRTYPSISSARRTVFNSSLQSRYGSLNAAPTAAMIAGAPFVLFIHSPDITAHRVSIPPSYIPETEHTSRSQWQKVCAGIAVFDHVQVSENHQLRGLVSAKLRNAVKEKSLAPVLVVVDLTADADLAAAADVLKAVCDAYGARLHVEGNALPMLLADDGSAGVRVMAGVAHSVLLDIGMWFGKLQLGVMLGIAGEVETQPDLGSAMALWYMLERIHLGTCMRLLVTALAGGRLLVDALDSVPHLLEVKKVGCAQHVLISYAAISANAQLRTSVNRAMLSYFQRSYTDFKHWFELASYENREWLAYSPMKILNDRFHSKPVQTELMSQISRDLIYAARCCEVVLNGRAAFISQMRQCQDVEVQPLASTNVGPSLNPLFFAGVRVTPFGEVSRNGHWIKDKDMTAIVEKYTYALASLLAEQENCFETVVQDSIEEGNDVPLICVGPKLSYPVCEVVESHNEKTAASSSVELDSNGKFAAVWDLDELAAQTMALDAACTVVAVLNAALSTPEELEVTENEESTAITDCRPSCSAIIESQDGEARPIQAPTKHEVKPELTAFLPLHQSGKEVTEGSTNANEQFKNVTESKQGEEAAFLSKEKPQDLNAINGKRGADVHSRAGFWGLFFGERNEKDADENSSVGSSKVLEDDYFHV